MGKDDLNELRAQVAREEAELRRLEADRQATQSRLAELQREIAALDSAAPTKGAAVPLADGPLTPAEKVKLFRQLFRGRQDLYPTRFVSKKTGKAGYAPACSNKFVTGVCASPLARNDPGVLAKNDPLLLIA
jgi:hypothetical protein